MNTATLNTKQERCPYGFAWNVGLASTPLSTNTEDCMPTQEARLFAAKREVEEILGFSDIISYTDQIDCISARAEIDRLTRNACLFIEHATKP